MPIFTLISLWLRLLCALCVSYYRYRAPFAYAIMKAHARDASCILQRKQVTDLGGKALRCCTGTMNTSETVMWNPHWSLWYCALTFPDLKRLKYLPCYNNAPFTFSYYHCTSRVHEMLKLMCLSGGRGRERASLTEGERGEETNKKLKYGDCVRFVHFPLLCISVSSCGLGHYGCLKNHGTLSTRYVLILHAIKSCPFPFFWVEFRI